MAEASLVQTAWSSIFADITIFFLAVEHYAAGVYIQWPETGKELIQSLLPVSGNST